MDIENELSKLDKAKFTGDGITKRQQYLINKLTYYNSEMIKIDNDSKIFATSPNSNANPNKSTDNTTKK